MREEKRSFLNYRFFIGPIGIFFSKMAKTLLVFSRIQKLVPLLEKHPLSSTLNIVSTSNVDEVKLHLPHADFIIADPTLIGNKELLQLATKCKWLQSTFAGNDALLKLNKEMKAPNFIITKLSGVFGKHISEYVLQQIINHERQFLKLHYAQKASKWVRDENYNYRTLDEITLGVMGYGDIGKHVCKTAKCFDMKVNLLKKTKSIVEHVDQVFYVDDREQFSKFFELNDYIVNILPSTHETRGLLNGDVLKSCKEGAVFINVGRGDIIDEDHLLNALENKWIKGAVLDVFQQEPLPTTSKLWNHPNVVITPHCSAMSFPRDICNLFYENLQLFNEKKPLKYVVDWEKGY